MNTYDDFSRRRDELDAGIRSGTVGCGFGKDMAEDGKILYAGPRGDPADLEKDVRSAIERFMHDTENRILYLIPEHQPQTHPQGAESSWELYTAVLQSLLAERKRTFEDSMDCALTARRPSLFHHRMVTRGVLRQLLASPLYKHYILERTSRDEVMGMDPSILQAHGQEDLTAFALGPYNRPRTALAHPRHADHFGIFLGYKSDIAEAFRLQPQKVQATHRWATHAVGYDFVQSLHLADPPIDQQVDNTAITTWALQERYRQSDIGKLRYQYVRQEAFFAS